MGFHSNQMLVKLILCATAAAATIEWRGITAKIKDRDILRGVGGQAKAGRLHAIMGPSGSGKTSLLSALSGTCDRRLKLSGDLRADGVALCGNQISGARRHRRDNLTHWLISTQAWPWTRSRVLT